MLRLLICSIALLVPATGIHAGPPATQASSESPRQVVEDGRRDILSALRDKSLTPARQSTQIQEAAAHRIDFRTLARISLGASWKTLSSTQQEQFVSEFRKHVLGICSGSTDGYTNEDLSITGEKKELNGDVTIQTRITGTRSDGSTRNVATVSFRLRNGEAGWKVIDVTIEGVSLAFGFHAQFQAIMRDGGFDALMQRLRDKNAARQASAPSNRR